MNDYVADIRQRLEQLNHLEDQAGESTRQRDQSLADDVLIKSLRAHISLSVLLHHDRLRARGRRSVAKVRHGVCSGCHMGLPAGTTVAVKHQTELVKCDHCGRYIFLAEDELSPAGSPKSPKKPSRQTTAPKKLNQVS